MASLPYKMSLRTASISCLAMWGAIWLMFLLLRLSPFDIRNIPGVGMILLTSLVLALVAPIAAAVLAAVAIVRQPRAPLNFLVFGCALLVLVSQVLLFFITGWM